MPEIIVPLAVEAVAIIWRLTPALVRDIIEDGISLADVEDYDLYEAPESVQAGCPGGHVPGHRSERQTRRMACGR